MTDHRSSFVAARLAKRVAGPPTVIPPVRFDGSPIPSGLIDSLRERLEAGETHYTARPGIPELRRAIGQELGRRGVVERDADGVIVTHGEGEALYVTLLGLGMTAGSKLVVRGQCTHRKLLDLMGIDAADAHDPAAARAEAEYREVTAQPGGEESEERSNEGTDSSEIVSLGSLLFSRPLSNTSTRRVSESAILIGDLDSLPALDHFRLGFVAGPPDVVKRIQTWKQALSICTAGPSQRAALFAIEEVAKP